MIIDAHHHFWRYNPHEFGWIPDEWSLLRRDFLPVNLGAALPETGVAGVISVQARRCMAETEFLLAQAEVCSLVRGVVGWVPMTDGATAEHLARYVENQHLVGVREILQGHADEEFLANPVFHRGLEAVVAAKLRYDLLVFHHQLPSAIACVDRHPDLTFILNHIAKPEIRRNEFDAEWARKLSELARRPNVWCKFSGLVTEVREPEWTVELLQPYFDAAFAAFGSKTTDVWLRLAGLPRAIPVHRLVGCGAAPCIESQRGRPA